ncbi:MAG TPA: carboxypeptidase regulatory-like domain-containing protein [Terracidiphilus sp.]|nr:carboxypeptidase regulatory-like domain-containing protein [Terracidiphilus sp.]
MTAPGKRRRWVRCGGIVRGWVAALVLLATAFAHVSASAQQDGGLQGILTDLYSHPLSGVTVVLRNTETGAETRAVTAKDGSYRAALMPGAYSLVAESPVLGQGQADGIVVTGGHSARIRTAIALHRQPPANPALLAAAPWQPAAGVANPKHAPAAETAPQVRALSGPVPAPVSEIAKLAPPDGPLSPALQPANASARAASLGAATGAAGHLALQVEDALPRAPLATAIPPVAETVSISTTITGEQLQSLPLAGRDWVQFALDAPVGSAEQARDPDSAGGRSFEPAAPMVEGTSTRLAFGGHSFGSRASSLAGSTVRESSIQEFQSAGFSGTQIAGEPIRIETRSGTNHWHGQAFLFNRQNLWGARNPFTQWMQESSPATITSAPVFSPRAWSPGDRRLTYGISTGSALLRNKLFWFAALDGDQRNDPAVSTVKHPENFFAQPANDEMQVLSARLGLSSSNPVAEGLAAYSKMLETLDALLGPAQRNSTHWSGFGRVDWHAAERHHFTFEGTGARFDSAGGGLRSASEAYGNHSFGGSRLSERWALGRWEAFVTPNLLVVTQGSMGRHTVAQAAETPSPFEGTLMANQWGQLPQMVVDSRYGFTIGNPARFGSGSYPNEHTYEAQEQLDWVHSKLLLRSGFELRHSADATTFLRNHTGTYHYATVENFVSDALVFAKYGLRDALSPMSQHNCDQRGKAWRDSAGQLHGLGYLPCYSWYTQTIGPTDWHLETNDWASFVTAQWEPNSQLVFSGGVRWERQQMPPPIALVNNPDLPLTQRVPSLGNQWMPRLSMAWGRSETRWPVLRFGYGMYFGRTPNSVLETAITQTGSPKGDLNLFLRPTDNLPNLPGGAPPFPYVLAGDPGTIEKPGAVEMAPNFRNAEIHQAEASADATLPGHIHVSASAVASLARRLPVTVDANFDPAVNPGTVTYEVVDASGKGPIKTPHITVPFFASWPSATGSTGRLNSNYQQISEVFSRANSTYEAGILSVSRYTRRGLSFHARYTYGHAMDWNPNESGQIGGASVLDPNDFRQEYGTSDLDIRHSFAAMTIWEPHWNLQGVAGRFANGWMLSGTGHFHSGLPYTMRTAGSITREFAKSGAMIAGLGPGMNGYGGDDRVYGVGRNTYRYPQTWKADLRMSRHLNLGHERELELLAETFNLFNHQNVTRVETTGYYIGPGTTSGSSPTLNFLTGVKPGQTEFGQPLNVNATDYFRERQLDFGLRLRFKRDPYRDSELAGF